VSSERAIENTRFGNLGPGLGKIAPCNPWIVAVQGNILTMIHFHTDETVKMDVSEHVGFYSEFYDTLEGFIDFCGEHAKCGLVTTQDAGRILFIYDNGPVRYPDHHKDGRPLSSDEIQGGEIDPQGENFGYAINIDIPYFSELGYASMFPQYGETDAERFARQTAAQEAMFEVFGGKDNVAIIEAPGTEIVERIG
jgi:hypothetical protein